MQLRYKSLLLITPLIILPIMGVGLLGFFQLKETLEQRVVVESNTLIEQIGGSLRDLEKIARSNIRLLAEHPLIRQYAITADETVRYDVMLSHVLLIFQSLHEVLPEYYEIRFILPDGYEDAHWLRPDIVNRSEEIAGDGYFADLQAMDGPQLVRLRRDENTGQYAMLVVQRLILNDPAVDAFGEDPRLRGYLAITVSLDAIRDRLQRYRPGDTGFLLLTDSAGEVLLGPDFVPLERLPDGIQALFSQARQDPSRHIYPTWRASVLAQDMLVRAGDIGPDALRLLAFYPRQKLLEAGYRLGSWVAYISLIAILVTVILVFAAIRRLILRPLQHLGKAAQAIGAGDLGYRIAVRSGDEIGLLADSFRTMSENLLQSHEQIRYLANHDGLTGLPNRTMFNNMLNMLMEHALGHKHRIALLFFDLDNFKTVNDTLGHNVGDLLLQTLARRLAESLRQSSCSEVERGAPCDLLARLGGDEFVILMNQVSDPWQASNLAERILQRVAEPVQLHNHQLAVSCSIGITLFPDDAGNMADLAKHADIAMYHAKEKGKNNYQFYSSAMNAAMQQRLEISHRIRVALEQDQFHLVYQPKVDTVSQRVVGMEALLRWQDPEHGAIAPSLFIPIAEETGLIVAITEWVLQKACRQNVLWQRQGLPDLRVAVNVSGMQFKRRDVVRLVQNALAASGLRPDCLEVELTESSLLTARDDAVDTLERLRDLGVQVALDDFGTGYSSLSYLTQFPIQVLKVDRSFVQSVGDQQKGQAIVMAIIAMGHALNLTIVAEGVETGEQLAFLREQRCDVIQGYLFSHPLPAEDFAALFQDTASLPRLQPCVA